VKNSGINGDINVMWGQSKKFLNFYCSNW